MHEFEGLLLSFLTRDFKLKLLLIDFARILAVFRTAKVKAAFFGKVLDK